MFFSLQSYTTVHLGIAEEIALSIFMSIYECVEYLVKI